LADELNKVGAAKRRLAELLRAGKAFNAQATHGPKIEAEEQRLKNSGLCCSDDPHVLALAIATGARVLHTHDGDLIDDFKNAKIVKPNGKIYKTAQHAHVLSHCRGCPGYVEKRLTPKRPK
jgi:hypothetical protein